MTKLPFDPANLDLSSILKMARDLQGQMGKLDETLSRIRLETMVGGGMVTVTVTGRGELVSVKLDPELLAMNNRTMVEDLLVAGVNQALAQAKARREEEMRKMTGSMVLPGFFA
jgi:nucleoid-associated protein EbfC